MLPCTKQSRHCETNLGLNGNNHYNGGSTSDLNSPALPTGPRPMVIAPRPACSPFGGHPGFGAAPAPATGAAPGAGSGGSAAVRNVGGQPHHFHQHHHHHHHQQISTRWPFDSVLRLRDYKLWKITHVRPIFVCCTAESQANM